MARVKIHMPEKIAFTTTMSVRFADLSIAQHLGNHILISYFNEAMVLMFEEKGFEVMNIEGRSLISADLMIKYQSESLLGDTLKIEVAIGEFSTYGCDLFYRVTNQRTGAVAALAKMGVLFFDYSERKVAPVPDSFRSKFQQYCCSVVPSL